MVWVLLLLAGLSFSPSRGFLALVRKPVAKRHQIPPNTTVSPPAEPRPSRAKVCGRLRVNALPSTPALPPALPTTHPGFAGSRVLPAGRRVLPAARCSARAALTAPSAGAEPRLCLHKTQLPGAWISKWATLIMLGLLSPRPSGPFRRVPALGCDTRVPLHPAVPPRRAFSCFRPPNSLNRSRRSFLSSFGSSLETGFHQDTEEKFIV